MSTRNVGRRRSPLAAYVALVNVVGVAILATFAARELHHPTHLAVGPLLVLGAIALVGELRPITVPGTDGEQTITTSSTFVFAALVGFGIVPALVAQVAASVVGDVIERKPPWKAGFNVGQYTASLVAADAAIRVTGVERGALDSVPAVAGVLLGASAFFLVNTALVSVAIALSQGRDVLGFFLRQLPFQCATECALLALAPIVVVSIERSLWLVPLLLLPLGAVYRGAAVAMRGDHERNHDALTGLPNRTCFRDRLTQGLGGEVHHSAILFLDLDGFKEVNDTLGHHTGDRLLAQAAPRLQQAVEGALVARLGGDEFAVWCPGVDQERAVTAARRLAEALSEPFTIDDLSIGLEASVGIALHPDHGADVDTLMQRADVAMYHAKGARTVVEVYDPERDPYSPQRLALLGELRDALDAGDQLVLHHQPQLELASGRIVAAEALVRWQHPERGLVPPDDFIPLAERTGLVGPLTRWVVGAALDDLLAWRSTGHHLVVAVNISVRNLYERAFPEWIAEELAARGLEGSALELEITEGMFVQDLPRARQALDELCALGVRIALDDFGTGYSSLAQLRRLPVHVLKIDRSFVQAIHDDRGVVQIVRSTIEMGASLGLAIVAEGVEDVETLDVLSLLGCTSAQGYLLTRPLPNADFLAWLDARAALVDVTDPPAAASEDVAAASPA
jgi:diguanylate cyclase (GGDEF)-like protein